VSASGSSDGPRTSRRALLQGAGALGLTAAAASSWLRPAAALAAQAAGMHGAARPWRCGAGHLLADYRPSQPTGWPPQQENLRNGVGVTIGGHVGSARFTLHGTPYEVSLVPFGQTAKAPDPVYEPEPADPTIDFKNTLEKAWGAWYSFRYRGGFTGRTAISVQSYSVKVTEPTATRQQLSYGSDLFMVYEPDPSSADPPVTADLRWIEVSNAGGKSTTEFRQRACPYYFPGGLTSVYGKQACSFYGAPTGGISEGKGKGTSADPPALRSRSTAESFLVHDTGQKDRAGKGIIDIYGGVKWGMQVKPVHSS
jgi:hypothetical protein